MNPDYEPEYDWLPTTRSAIVFVARGPQVRACGVAQGRQWAYAFDGAIEKLDAKRFLIRTADCPLVLEWQELDAILTFAPTCADYAEEQGEVMLRELAPPGHHITVGTIDEYMLPELRRMLQSCGTDTE